MDIFVVLGGDPILHRKIDFYDLEQKNITPMMMSYDKLALNRLFTL